MADNGVLPHRIYHLALEADWNDAARTGESYRRSTIGRSLDEEGFIHCSFAHQVQGTADRFYRHRNDVVLLAIDTSKLDAEVRIENLEGGTPRFPHVYGPLPRNAVVHAHRVPVGPDGSLGVWPLVDAAD